MYPEQAGQEEEKEAQEDANHASILRLSHHHLRLVFTQTVYPSYLKPHFSPRPRVRGTWAQGRGENQRSV
jgi:hypothetical protein